jgi:hypothetical protein
VKRLEMKHGRKQLSAFLYRLLHSPHYDCTPHQPPRPKYTPSRKSETKAPPKLVAMYFQASSEAILISVTTIAHGRIQRKFEPRAWYRYPPARGGCEENGGDLVVEGEEYVAPIDCLGGLGFSLFWLCGAFGRWPTSRIVVVIWAWISDWERQKANPFIPHRETTIAPPPRRCVHTSTTPHAPLQVRMRKQGSRR